MDKENRRVVLFPKGIEFEEIKWIKLQHPNKVITAADELGMEL